MTPSLQVSSYLAQYLHMLIDIVLLLYAHSFIQVAFVIFKVKSLINNIFYRYNNTY